MKKSCLVLSCLFLTGVISILVANNSRAHQETVVVKPTTNDSISQRLNALAPHPFTDSRIKGLPEKTRQLLKILVQAADVIDVIYLEQVHPLNLQWIQSLHNRQMAGDASARQYLDYFRIAYGPWDIFTQEWILPVERHAPMLPLEGFNVYPIEVQDGALVSVSKARLDQWLIDHPQDAAAFRSPYTVIRFNSEDNGFEAIPYSVAYRPQLETAARLLEEAARYTDDEKLKRLLLSRAKAFRTNQYNETEPDWIATHDTEIQLLIGPYEETVDNIWGLKRGFGAQIGLKDPRGTADLQSYKALGDEFQANMPIDPKYHPDRPKEPFFTVWNRIYTTGQAREGLPAIGQKLPNDRSITIEHGARQNFYKESQDGKCEKVLLPISKLVLVPSLHAYVTCESFFKFTLHHEYAHALGVAFIYPDWENPDPATRSEVNDGMPKWGGRLEELKADTLGMHNRQYMLDNGLEAVPDTNYDLRREMYASALAGFFRSVRFGLTNSYALNAMIMLNHLVDAGAVVFDEKQGGRVDIVPDKFPAVLKSNAQDALMLQVENSDEKVAEYYAKYSDIRPATQKLLDAVNAAQIPRDIYPQFPDVISLR